MDVADFAGVDQFDGFADSRPGAALVAHLDDAVVLAGGFDEELAFEAGVAARFFDVNMFSGLDRQDAHPGVPVVGRGDDDGVDFGIFENAAEIAFGFRSFALFFGGLGGGLLHDFAVDIANVGDFGVFRESGEEAAAAGVDADHGDADAVAGSLGESARKGASQGETGSGKGGGFKKIAAGEEFCHFHVVLRVQSKR